MEILIRISISVGVASMSILPPFLMIAKKLNFLAQYSAFLHVRGDAKSATPQEHFDGNKKEGGRRFEYSKVFLIRTCLCWRLDQLVHFF